MRRRVATHRAAMRFIHHHAAGGGDRMRADEVDAELLHHDGGTELRKREDAEYCANAVNL